MIKLFNVFIITSNYMYMYVCIVVKIQRNNVCSVRYVSAVVVMSILNIIDVG